MRVKSPSKAEIERALYPKRNKFSAKRTNGYHSKREATVAAQLQALERGGQITELKEQVRFELVPAQKGERRNEKPLVYIADFVYRDQSGAVHTIDVKGMLTREYVIKRKLMAFLLKIEVEEF